jgi:hypothetical protein
MTFGTNTLIEAAIKAAIDSANATRKAASQLPLTDAQIVAQLTTNFKTFIS